MLVDTLNVEEKDIFSRLEKNLKKDAGTPVVGHWKFININSRCMKQACELLMPAAKSKGLKLCICTAFLML